MRGRREQNFQRSLYSYILQTTPPPKYFAKKKPPNPPPPQKNKTKNPFVFQTWISTFKRFLKLLT